MLYLFRVWKLIRERKHSGVVYKCKLKSADGHSLTLVSNEFNAFKGYSIGDQVQVDVKKMQRSLEETIREEDEP